MRRRLILRSGARLSALGVSSSWMKWRRSWAWRRVSNGPLCLMIWPFAPCWVTVLGVIGPLRWIAVCVIFLLISGISLHIYRRQRREGPWR